MGTAHKRNGTADDVSEKPIAEEAQVLASVTVNIAAVYNGCVSAIAMIDLLTMEPSENLSLRIVDRFHYFFLAKVVYVKNFLVTHSGSP